MLLKIIIIINLVWQSVFLIGAVESISKLSKLGTGHTFTFGYLWLTLLWGFGVSANLLLLIYLLKTKKNIEIKKQVIIGLLLVMIPITISYIIGGYYQLNLINIVSQ